VGRLVRTFLAAALLLTVVLVGLSTAAWFWVQRELTPDRAATLASEALGREVRLASLDLHLFPVPHLSARWVSITPGGTARLLELRPRLAPLLERRFELASLRLVAPRIALVLTEEGLALAGDEGSGPAAELPEFESIPELEVIEARISLRDETVSPAIPTKVRIERLEVQELWIGAGREVSLRAAFGEAGHDGLLDLAGRVESTGDGLRVAAYAEGKALDADLVRRQFPSRWDTRSATGTVDGTAELEWQAGHTDARLDLTLQGGEADLAGVKLAGETRLRGRILLAPDSGTILEGAVLDIESLRVDRQQATGLHAEFDYAEATLELHALRMASVAAGIEAAAALGLPGANSVPIEVQLEEAGQIAFSGRLSLVEGDHPGGAEARGFALPALDAHGSVFVLVHDPGPDEQRTRFRIEHLELRDFVEGGTATLDFDTRVGEDEGGRIKGRGTLGPITRAAHLEQPLQLAVTVEKLQAEHLLPYVPESWPVPGELGPIDATVEARQQRAADLHVDLAAHSSVGSGDSPGRVDVELAVRPRPESPSELEIGLDIHDLDLALLAHDLPSGWGLTETRGMLTGTSTLRGTTDGEIFGKLDLRVASGLIASDELQIRGGLRLRSDLERRSGRLGISHGELEAEELFFPGGIEGRAGHARGSLLPPVLEVEFARFEAYGGVVENTGSFVLGSPLRFEVDVHAAGLDTSALAGAQTEGSQMEIEARLAGTWEGSGNWIAPIEGSGKIQLRGGDVTGVNLLRAIALGLVGLIPGSQHLISERESPQTVLATALIPFHFGDEEIEIEGMDVVTDDYRVRGAMTLSHELAFDVDGTAALTAKGVESTLSMITGAVPFSGTISFPPIPIDVRGSLRKKAETHVGVDVTAIPLATVRGLLGLPIRAGAAVTGAAKRGVDKLMGKAPAE
jgi:hypothetical protein